jgi:hypothetical protein
LDLIAKATGFPMDFLKTKGKGMQHLGFMIEDSEDIERMESLGYNVYLQCFRYRGYERQKRLGYKEIVSIIGIM